MRNTDANELKVVVFREGPFWLAQALEKDIGVQAGTFADLIKRFAVVLSAEAAAPGFSALPPAPPYFQHLWPARAGVLASPDGGRFAPVEGFRLTFGLVA